MHRESQDALIDGFWMGVLAGVLGGVGSWSLFNGICLFFLAIIGYGVPMAIYEEGRASARKKIASLQQPAIPPVQPSPTPREREQRKAKAERRAAELDARVVAFGRERWQKMQALVDIMEDKQRSEAERQAAARAFELVHSSRETADLFLLEERGYQDPRRALRDIVAAVDRELDRRARLKG